MIVEFSQNKSNFECDCWISLLLKIYFSPQESKNVPQEQLEASSSIVQVNKSPFLYSISEKVPTEIILNIKREQYRSKTDRD